MSETIDIEKELLSGNIEVINKWLREKVHKFGKLKSPKEIILNATGEPLNANYYTNYLEEKFSKIYR